MTTLTTGRVSEFFARISEFFARIDAVGISQRLIIDVLDACNLRCTDCPRGQIGKNTSNRLTPEQLARILDKAQAECHVQAVGLYNWTEPFLHPQLPEMVRAVKSRNIDCRLSTNLALRRIPTLEGVIQQRPNLITVSVSGFSQEVYGRYHKGGSIETVKANLQSMVELVNKYGSKEVTVKVDYLQFIDNSEEAPLMKRFCEDLGIGFLEKPARAAEGATTEKSRKRLLPFRGPQGHQCGKEDQEPREHWPCRLLDDILAIDACGDVYLCCALWNYPKYYIANYLDTPLKDLFRLRMSHPRCKACLHSRRKPQKSDLLLRYSREAIEHERVVTRKKEIEGIRRRLAA